MKLFEDLDEIIKHAIKETMDDERSRQKSQSSKIQKLGLRASDSNERDAEVSEADEDEEADKLKGDSEEGVVKKKEGEEEAETPGTATSKKLKDPSQKQIKKPTFQAIANNINLLRGGKSIKDPEVRSNLKDYIEKLNIEERRQVLVYLNSLAQVMSGRKTGAEAEDPNQAEREALKKKLAPDSPRTSTSKKSNVIVVGKQ